MVRPCFHTLNALFSPNRIRLPLLANAHRWRFTNEEQRQSLRFRSSWHFDLRLNTRCRDRLIEQWWPVLRVRVVSTNRWMTKIKCYRLEVSVEDNRIVRRDETRDHLRSAKCFSSRPSWETECTSDSFAYPSPFLNNDSSLRMFQRWRSSSFTVLLDHHPMESRDILSNPWIVSSRLVSSRLVSSRLVSRRLSQQPQSKQTIERFVRICGCCFYFPTLTVLTAMPSELRHQSRSAWQARWAFTWRSVGSPSGCICPSRRGWFGSWSSESPATPAACWPTLDRPPATPAACWPTLDRPPATPAACWPTSDRPWAGLRPTRVVVRLQFGLRIARRKRREWDIFMSSITWKKNSPRVHAHFFLWPIDRHNFFQFCSANVFLSSSPSHSTLGLSRTVAQCLFSLSSVDRPIEFNFTGNRKREAPVLKLFLSSTRVIYRVARSAALAVKALLFENFAATLLPCGFLLL